MIDWKSGILGVCAALAMVAAPAQNTSPAKPGAWWKNAVIYEIYPRSFGDTNGDGIGDLNGITEHLDYLADLGIDAIWIAPFYPSPQVDFGYDISDYDAIDPQYGTMADFDRLVAEARKRNIRVITDLVLNHTSDLHAWFKESRSSRDNPKADWYVWHDGRPSGEAPNDWLSLFGHSAWQWEPARKQYYYHMFYREQPDLNWNNAEVRKAIDDMIRRWMQRGVEGFRLDAITTLFEDPELRDDPMKDTLNGAGDRDVDHVHTDNLPRLHDAIRELRHVADEMPGRVLIGEVYLPNVQELAKMYGAKNDEFQLPMDTQYGFLNHLSAADFRARLREAETELNGNVPLLVFDNHDNRRSWDRYADGLHNDAIARLIAALLLAPKASSLMYYGQEIGMVTTDPKSKADVRDPVGVTAWPLFKGRDGERTPMQWTSGRNAGFSTAAETWLPVAPDYSMRNVESERRDPGSLFNFYKALIRLRRENAAFRDGEFALVNENDPNVLSFVRRAPDGATVLVALNVSASPQAVNYDRHGVALLSSFAATGATADLKTLSLPAYGVWVGQVR